MPFNFKFCSSWDHILGAVTGLGSLALPGTTGEGVLTHLTVCDTTHIGFASPYEGRKVYTGHRRARMERRVLGSLDLFWGEDNLYALLERTAERSVGGPLQQHRRT